MDIAEKRNRISELTELLDKAARAYEQEDREIISNLEYDRLYDELRALEEETGIILAGSPTQHAGYEVLSSLPKERHPQPMLSLDKTKDRIALAAWLKDKEGLLSWKMDGLTVVLYYAGGRLVKAVTRGNGEIGEVVTANARTFKNVPLKIPYQGDLVLRGEAVIRYSDFERMNAAMEEGEVKYKNPRNLCSGSVRQLNSEITAKRNVFYYAFSLIQADQAEEFLTRSAQMEWLSGQGFETVGHSLVNQDTILETIEQFARNIEKNDFPSDGLVLTYDDIAYGETLGRTAKFPRNAIAFKWADEQAETVLREIEWSASRTGLINPVAIFDSVELEGTTVSRASLHNISIMEELQLGIGDSITVYKANMIIPQVAENLTRNGNIAVPTKCPVCGGETFIRDENGVKALFCMNEGCMAKKIKKITHLVSRDALNIEGLSEATIEKFINCGILHAPQDIFEFGRFRDEITSMEGFGEKSYLNLISAVEKARRVTLARLIYSMGIPNVGLANAKLICSAFNNDIAAIRNASALELTDIPNIGQVIADSVVDFFNNEDNAAVFDAILSKVNLVEEAKQEKEGLVGKTFVITGSVEHFANRNELKAAIELAGGKVTGSVTKNTDYLINNDSTSGSSKNKKAQELGVKIITEEEFLELAGTDA